MFKYIILTVIFGYAAAIHTPCTNCNSNSVKLPAQLAPVTPTGSCKSVQIEPCTNLPCPLKKNTTVTFQVTFQAGQVANKLTAKVYGVINKVPIPFPLPNNNGCKDSGISCPLVAGQTYVYKDSLFIQNSYPQVSVVVRWSLEDENGNTVFCVVVPAKITN